MVLNGNYEKFEDQDKNGRMEEKKEGRCEAFGWFKTHVLDSKLEIGIDHQELVSEILK